MIRSTLCACQRPPLGVAMPRAANSAAIRRADEFRLRMFESQADMIYRHVPDSDHRLIAGERNAIRRLAME
jgi:hypothetical protein